MEAEALRITAPLLAWRTESGRRRGFGSVKVNAWIGESHWSTSLFPPKEGGWFLPVKKAICRAEGLETGDMVTARLDLL